MIIKYQSNWLKVYTQWQDLMSESGEGESLGDGSKGEGVWDMFEFYKSPRWNMVQHL